MEISSDSSFEEEIDALGEGVGKLTSPSKSRTFDISDDELVDYCIRKPALKSTLKPDPPSSVQFSDPRELPVSDIHHESDFKFPTTYRQPKDKDEAVRELALIINRSWFEGTHSDLYSTVSLGLLLADELKSHGIHYQLSDTESLISIFQKDARLPFRIILYKNRPIDFDYLDDTTILIYKRNNKPLDLETILVSNPRIFAKPFSEESKLAEWLIQFLRSLAFMTYK